MEWKKIQEEMQPVLNGVAGGRRRDVDEEAPEHYVPNSEDPSVVAFFLQLTLNQV